jgi:hypothetical protein
MDTKLISKRILEKRYLSAKIGLSGRGQELVTGPCEYHKEIFGSVKGGRTSE